MRIKTSESYQKEVLEKYNECKSQELSTYLLNPTPKLIKQACILLLDKRTSINDNNTLNCFFQFKNEKNKLREVKSFDNDKFKPIVNFLKGKVQKTSSENIELLSCIIDFSPRPLHQYLKLENNSSQKSNTKSRGNKNYKTLVKSKKNKIKKGRHIITISISIIFGMTLLIFGIQKWTLNNQKNNSKIESCMTWADSLYITISCNTGPLSKFGTKVKPMQVSEFENMQKVKVNAAYDFFTEEGKPRIWYYKKKEGEHEYFTAPGLHPINGETLKKITPYIIKTYVPLHLYKEDSFTH